MIIAIRKTASGENGLMQQTPLTTYLGMCFPTLGQHLILSASVHFPFQAQELGLLAAVPVCVLVVYQTVLTARLHAPFFLSEASMVNTKQGIIKTYTIIPAFHG